ncbi:MAG: IS21-like element helper ATPase IstB [bacterium]|jgi:DNA replication protein DnaC
MSIEKKTYDEIIEYTKELKLPGIRQRLNDEIEKAFSEDAGYDIFLLNMLKREYENRVERRKLAGIRNAGFPYKKYLEDLDTSAIPAEAAKNIKQFKTLGFIENGQNIILAGNPGTGKTHIAIGLGINACLAGYKVLFTTVPGLVTKLKESRSERTLRQTENRFEKYDLVICDELGYISFDKEGAELLFTNLSLRAGRKSTIVTTNLTFDRWTEIFHDPVLTAAMVDRLTHKAYLVNMTGQSYRIKETKEWMMLKKNEKKS